MNSYGYECGNNDSKDERDCSSDANHWTLNDGREFVLSNSSTPDTINSDLGYNSVTSPVQNQTHSIIDLNSPDLQKENKAYIYNEKAIPHERQKNSVSPNLKNLSCILKDSDLLVNNKVVFCYLYLKKKYF